MIIEEELKENKIEEVEPVEEKPQEPIEEEKPEEAVESIEAPSDVLKIEKPNPDNPPYNEAIEVERKAILAAEKKSRLRSTISLFIVLGCGIAAIALLSVNQIISYVLLGVAIVALLIPFFLNKKSSNAPDVKGYITKANYQIDTYLYSKTEFSDVTMNPTEKIDLGEVIADGIYNGIINISSRNVVRGLYKGVGFTAAEMALFKVKTNTKSQTYFVGKYLMVPNNLHFEGRFVLLRENIEPAKKMDSPNALDDLVVLFQEDGFAVYGPEGADYTKYIPASVIRSFKEMSINKLLVNNILIVWAGRSILYSSYDDKVISLPFYEPLDTEALASFKNDLETSIESLHTIWEKK